LERWWEDLRRPHRSHKDPTPRYYDLSGSEAAQFDFVARQISANPANLALKFDTWTLRTDLFRRFGCQNSPLSAGVHNQGDRMPICRKSYKGNAVQGCDHDVSEEFCATAECVRDREQVGSNCRSRNITITGHCP